MSKTFQICLIVIVVYVVIIFPKVVKNNKQEKEEKEVKADTQSGTNLNENVDKNGVSQGASGQQKYRIGYVS